MAKKIRVPGYSSFGPHHIVFYRGKEYLVPTSAQNADVMSAIDEEIASQLMVELFSFAVLATMTLVNASVKAVKKEYERYKIKRFSNRPSRRIYYVGQIVDKEWKPLSNA